MSDEVRERLETWLGMNRDFLWKVMNHKEKVDAIFRDRSVGFDELTKTCDEVETYLDEIKDMLKKLYLILYETQDLIKKAREKQEAGHEFEEELKRKKDAAEKREQEEAELRRKMERERIEAVAKGASGAAPAKPSPTAKPTPAPAPAKPEAAPASKAKSAPVEKADAPAQHLATLDVAKETASKKKSKRSSKAVEVPDFDLKIPEKIAGLVNFLGLGEWFKGIAPEQQKEVVGVMISDGKMSAFDILERDIQTLRPQFAPYCWKTANKLMRKGHDELATGLLIKGLTVVTQKRDKEMLHIMYAKYFYRQRKTLNNAYDACINHCQKAIKSYRQDKENRPKPVAPFKLLTMIYEEKNDIDKIIRVCDEAIKLYQGSADESKVLGFLRIKDILEKKEKQVKEQQAKPKA